MNEDSYKEARAHAEAGDWSSGGDGQGRIIPGLYGFKMGGWVEWDPDREVRLARVDRFFGKSPE